VTKKAKSITEISSQLATTRGSKIVKFFRPFDDGGSTQGYVLDIGPEFFLLLLIGEEMRFNGFQCLRLQDVRKLQVPAKYAAFIESALRLRGECVEKKPMVRVGNIKEILETANKAFPIITIHREKVAPDICHIGQILDMDEKYVSLLEIGPDAVWDQKPESYRLREITRVDFGGAYEEALILVGGSSPIARASKRKKLPDP